MHDFLRLILLFTGIALGFMLMCLLVGCKNRKPPHLYDIEGVELEAQSKTTA